MNDAILYQVDAKGIAVITINRPAQRNCLSREVREGLRAAWQRFENDSSARIGILTGSGDTAFCAGGDLKEMVETGLKVPARDMFPVPYENITLSKPTIAAVNGVAFAGGVDDCAGLRPVCSVHKGQICHYRSKGWPRLTLGRTADSYDSAAHFYGDCVHWQTD
jgi:enoyl-CoA hydratase/carnithine racemase